jgi:hypothetical protein
LLAWLERDIVEHGLPWAAIRTALHADERGSLAGSPQLLPQMISIRFGDLRRHSTAA